MPANTRAGDGRIEWYTEPVDGCDHEPIPASLCADRAPVDCLTCGASGELIPR
ncbi:hypothetical protein [Halomontanus rarus]|uniref:hypothetical protein n=1 Tax=Halomontanus rarus TaxID=3034020 RepID=UPI00307C9117